jgi:hypothetical protein
MPVLLLVTGRGGGGTVQTRKAGEGEAVEDEDTQRELLEHARRQTDALGNIQGALMLLLALAIIAALIGLVLLVRA